MRFSVRKEKGKRLDLNDWRRRGFCHGRRFDGGGLRPIYGGGMAMALCRLLRSTPVFLARRWSCSGEDSLLRGKAASIRFSGRRLGFLVLPV
ncbi:hypothetical protein ISN45_Aa03g030970 [Arabidopsis thaliana x Arabidopsis arenosa]|uniref:Uncharacterized protein n=1 Tax=Arabidopsis thaliana x Arabidopsis arenosa TaxID=1240361 RepID=A0A8T2B052_9BRAS|nr:hypothetical protein ISN45_Aa03g030970 [Arabidopsis thaliana x Arabidopsis arenosa]